MNAPPILNDPIGLAIITLVVVTLLYYQRGLGWHDYHALHKARVLAFKFVLAIRPTGSESEGVPLFQEKEYRNHSREYLTTWDGSVRAVFEHLIGDGGGSPHLISSVKYRELPNGDTQYSAAHVVWTHDDGTQTECYLWGNADDTTDVYVHHEESVADADGHLEEGGVAGDPRGVVRDALGLE